MKVAILGATRGIGRALARQLAARGDRLHLLGRNLEDLQRSARDIELRSPSGSAVECSMCDLEDPQTFEAALDGADVALGCFDTVVVTAGAFGTQEALESDASLAQRVLLVDFTHTILFCEQVRTRLLARGGGTLCVLSSVAGDRGRKTVVLYGAAKAGLSHYLEGLDSRYRLAGLKTVCIKPGFVRTSMTAGLPEPPFAAEADDVAAVVVAALDRGAPVVYAPRIWWPVMTVIRLLPRFMMRRLNV